MSTHYPATTATSDLAATVATPTSPIVAVSAHLQICQRTGCDAADCCQVQHLCATHILAPWPLARSDNPVLSRALRTYRKPGSPLFSTTLLASSGFLTINHPDQQIRDWEKNETRGDEKNIREKKKDKKHVFLKNMLVGLFVSSLPPPWELVASIAQW